MRDFNKEMLAVIQGDRPDGLLFVPRLDIWYNWNKARGTLPAGYESLTLFEIAQKLGVAVHSVVPAFIDTPEESDIYHRGLGFYNYPDFPYRIDFSDVDYEVEKSESELRITYHSASGAITTRFRYGRSVLDSGATIPDMLEYPLKKESDYTTLAEIMAKVKVLPALQNYRTYQKRIGKAGIAVAFISLAAGPMHHIMRDLRKFDDFCFDQYDYPQKMKEACEPLGEIYDKMLSIGAESSAQVLLFGANYDSVITPPPFFNEYIAPWLNKAADMLHQAGKYLLTHTDGENNLLLSLLQESRFDIADSICPAPMTRISLREYRDKIGQDKVIWGGLPSVLLLKDSCSEQQFKSFTQQIINDFRPYDHLILGIADTTPPNAEFERILYLCQECSKT